MKYFFVFALVICGTLTAIDGTEPVCSYLNTQGETIFLKYLPLLKTGQDYVDFDVNGVCTKRAICSDTFKTQIEPCSKFPVTCANKKTYKGVFPACCVKC